jgi:hypothetical protein
MALAWYPMQSGETQSVLDEHHFNQLMAGVVGQTSSLHYYYLAFAVLTYY